jgi:hypothetical protein
MATCNFFLTRTNESSTLLCLHRTHNQPIIGFTQKNWNSFISFESYLFWIQNIPHKKFIWSQYMGIRSLWVDWKNTTHSSSLGNQGSKVVENTLAISPYKIFLNDSNRHGCYFKKY